MASYNSSVYTAQNAGTKQVVRPAPGAEHTMWSIVEIAAAQTANDLLRFFFVPADAVIVGGYMLADDIDTGTEVLEIDVGTVATPALLVNSGVLTGDATEATAAPNIRVFDGLLATEEGVSLGGNIGEKTAIVGKCIVAANAGGTGTVGLNLTYRVP
jgi:hypothetical protein